MPVVINEFEVLGDPGSASPDAAGAPPGEAAAVEELEPADLRPALRQLEIQELRVWAH